MTDGEIIARLDEWRATLAHVGSESPLTEKAVRSLWHAVEDDRRRMRLPEDHLETPTVNAIMDFSRWLAKLVRRLATPHGILGAELFQDERQSRSEAWEDFIAAVEVAKSAKSGAPLFKKDPPFGPRVSIDTRNALNSFVAEWHYGVDVAKWCDEYRRKLKRPDWNLRKIIYDYLTFPDS